MAEPVLRRDETCRLCGGKAIATVLQLAFATTGLGLLLLPLAKRMTDRWERRRAAGQRIIRIQRIRRVSLREPELVA